MRDEQQATVVLMPLSAILTVSACSVHSLTVTGEDSALHLQFGPLPLFHKCIPYDSMSSTESARSTFIDGWGIHWAPSRGWTYNILGFDCVLIHKLDRRQVRVGTEDVDGLVSFLKEQIDGP